MLTIPDGMGTWLAVFDNNGDLAGSISKRPVLLPIYDLLEEKGDEIFENTDSVVLDGCTLSQYFLQYLCNLCIIF